MKKLLAITLLCAAQSAFSAFEHFVWGSRVAAMGNSLVAVEGNSWAAFTNPALLHTVGERTLSIGYAPQPFGLPELARGAVSFVEPTSVGSFAVSASRFGFDLYKEIGFAASYANNLTDDVAGGITLNYYSLSIARYGSAATVAVDAGLLIRISEEVRWGFSACNINAAAIGAAREKLPQVYSTGIAFRPTSEALVTAGIIKDIRFAAELHVGLEYNLLGVVALRAGTTTDPNTLNAGVGIAYSFLRLDYAFTSHDALGATHQFSLSFVLGSL